MSRDFRKFMVRMRFMIDDYRMWKSIDGKIMCVFESYKNKRSLYLSVSNLIPSASLTYNEKSEYRIVLMGVDEGQLIHKDFGAFFVNQRGEGFFFKKFEGPPVEAYTHCLIIAVNKETGSARTILSGEMPFYQKEEEHDIWGNWLETAFAEKVYKAFSPDIDETGAEWYRIQFNGAVPEPIEMCFGQIKEYGHFLLGRNRRELFVGIPGRFLKAEKPGDEAAVFALWQPIRGGERFFKNLSELDGDRQEEIFGYWIAGINRTDGQLIPV